MSDVVPDLKDRLKDWRLSIDQENIAWAVFDRENESANSLGRRPLEELMVIVDHIEKESRAGRVKGLVLMSGKEKGFIVGADIREFEQLKTEAQVAEAIRPVNAMLDQIEAMPVPVVAAVHGVCLGGGLELILACHWRIGTRDDATRVGFPEVKLGIFPGFNGTARSIRQAGPFAAMKHMLSGSMVRHGAARACRLLRRVGRLATQPALGRPQGRAPTPPVQARFWREIGPRHVARARTARQEDARGNSQEGARGPLSGPLPPDRSLRALRRHLVCCDEEQRDARIRAADGQRNVGQSAPRVRLSETPQGSGAEGPGAEGPWLQAAACPCDRRRRQWAPTSPAGAWSPAWK